MKIKLVFPYTVEDLVKMLAQAGEMDGEITAIDNDSLKIATTHFSIIFPIRDVVETIKLSLPAWSRDRIRVPREETKEEEKTG